MTVRLFATVIHFQTSSQALRHSIFTYPVVFDPAVFDLDASENELDFINFSFVYVLQSYLWYLLLGGWIKFEII